MSTTVETQPLPSPAPRAPRALVRPPGPSPRKAGVIGRVRYGLNFMLDPLGFVGGRFARFGDVYFVGGEDQPGLYVMRHPEHLEQVLVEKAKSFAKTHSAFAQLSQVLGDGLLTTDGDVWRRQRRLIQPAFSKKRLEGYAVAMAAESEAEAARWREGETRDLSVDMMELTLRIVCRTLFGHDARGDAESVRRSMQAFQDSLIGLSLPVPDWASPSKHRLRRATAALDAIIYRMIEERRAGGEPSDDLLSMLLAAKDDEGDGRGLSEREVRDQLVTLFLAGHETTANALTWTFYLLAEHPEVEARLHAELDAVLGGRTPTYADLAALPYTAQVFDEAMRLYPPVYMTARKAREDVDIGGWLVPEGSEVVLWTWHTHRDPRFWDEPWAFRPERFDKVAVAARPKLAYAPFGAGPRACIGKVFAQIEGQLALATLASRWRPRLPQGYVAELHPRITLSPAGGLPVRLERRPPAR